MIKSKYKPPEKNGGASYNIRYCPKCGKYQHFSRKKTKDGYRDCCYICKYKLEVK